LASASPAETPVLHKLIFTNAFDQVPQRFSFLDRQHLLQALLNLIQVTSSYLLMLVAMSFNLWILLAIITGEHRRQPRINLILTGVRFSGLSGGFFVFGGRHRNPRNPDRRCFD
jgi:hypothetical protein